MMGKALQNAGLSSTVMKVKFFYVCGLQTFWTFGNIERYLVAFRKGFKALACNGGEVYKNIFTCIMLNKTKTLTVIKPFYLTFWQFTLLLNNSLAFVRSHSLEDFTLKQVS